MNRNAIRCLAAGLIIATSTAAQAQQENALKHALGGDVTYTTDADDTEVVRAGLNADWRYAGPESYRGFRIERLHYRPASGTRNTDTRVYLRMADSLGGWQYQALPGTDGHTVVGSASIHNEARFRQEFFIERDKIETPVGVSQGLYYTFGGAAVDVPIGAKTQVTVLGGVQEFTGDNIRYHLRGNFIQTLKSDWGLSAQLRTRYFRDSEPGEHDYYSPRWYAEVLPVLQMRRFVEGWRLVAAAGLGGQRDSDSGWRASRYLNLRAERRALVAGWGVTGEAVYTSQPITNSSNYHYLRATLGVTRAF